VSSEIVGGRAPAAYPPTVFSKLKQASTISPKAKPILEEEQRQRPPPPDPAALAALAAEHRVRMEMNTTIREHKKAAAREEDYVDDLIWRAAAHRATQILSEASAALAARLTRGAALAASLISAADVRRAERILNERDEQRTASRNNPPTSSPATNADEHARQMVDAACQTVDTLIEPSLHNFTTGHYSSVDISILRRHESNVASRAKVEPPTPDRARVIELTQIDGYSSDFQKLSHEEKKARRLELKNESQRRIRAAKRAEKCGMVGWRAHW
jgi:hypothetical protein